MLVVGLTGNIAAGKSAVAQQLVARGAWLIDADQLAREAVAPGSPGLAAIRARWGDAVLGPDGDLDRAALRRIVFADAAERAALDAIVHPAVTRHRDRELARAASAGARIVIADIPLLFETGLDRSVDLVVLVDAPEALRRERLVRDRGLDAAEAQAMIDAQMPSRDKRARAAIVLDNDGSREALAAECARLWAALEAAATAKERAAADEAPPATDGADA